MLFLSSQWLHYASIIERVYSSIHSLSSATRMELLECFLIFVAVVQSDFGDPLCLFEEARGSSNGWDAHKQLCNAVR